nr:hypothetical protein [Tanacetum cinerariifolium]
QLRKKPQIAQAQSDAQGISLLFPVLCPSAPWSCRGWGSKPGCSLAPAAFYEHHSPPAL